LVEERDVLPVGGLRRRDLLALGVLQGLDLLRVHDELPAAGGRAADDLRALATGLDVTVDRRGRADPADVDGAGVERLDLGRARVEDTVVRLCGAQFLLEQALLTVDE